MEDNQDVTNVSSSNNLLEWLSIFFNKSSLKIVVIVGCLLVITIIFTSLCKRKRPTIPPVINKIPKFQDFEADYVNDDFEIKSESSHSSIETLLDLKQNEGEAELQDNNPTIRSSSSSSASLDSIIEKSSLLTKKLNISYQDLDQKNYETSLNKIQVEPKAEYRKSVSRSTSSIGSVDPLQQINFTQIENMVNQLLSNTKPINREKLSVSSNDNNSVADLIMKAKIEERDEKIRKKLQQKMEITAKSLGIDLDPSNVGNDKVSISGSEESCY